MRLRRSLAWLAVPAVVLGPGRAVAQDDKPPVQVRLVPAPAPEPRFGRAAILEVDVETLQAPPPEGHFFNPLWSRNDQQIQYLLLKFRPLLQAELVLLERVCKPNSSQRQQVKQESEWALQQAAENVATAVAASRRGPRPRRLAYRDPSRLIEENLLRIVRNHLSPRQVESYRTEVEKRDADQKRYGARSLVVLLDDALYLSSDQREQIVGALVAHWDDAWFLTVDALSHDEPQLPEIPGECVEPFLTETQKTAWKALPRAATLHFGNFGFVGDLMMLGD